MGDEILNRLDAAAKRYEEEVLEKHSELRAAEENSVRELNRVRDHLSRNPPPEEHEAYVLAVAGSLARREASGLSDIDLIMVTNHDEQGGAAKGAEPLMNWRNVLCETLDIEPPNSRGVFHRPTSRAQIQTIAGASDEQYDDMSKRVLFLLESEWVFNAENYNKLLDSLIDRYSEDVSADPRKNFVFLLNDVVRYFRLVCVNYQQTKTETPDGKWPLRNVKLRHSRVLMYFSMVAAIGTLSKVRDRSKIDALKSMVRMPPLKRLFVAYEMADDECFYRVAGLYDTFLRLLSIPETRERLTALDYADRYDSGVFAQLKANSDAFAAELMRFYDARRGTWDERFFEYMIL